MSNVTHTEANKFISSLDANKKAQKAFLSIYDSNPDIDLRYSPTPGGMFYLIVNQYIVAIEEIDFYGSMEFSIYLNNEKIVSILS